MNGRDEIEALIARVGLHDRAAFSDLYARTSAKLFGVCLRILRDRAAAEDAVQEVYVKVWYNADRFAAGGYSPMTWLITIARNHAIDRVRAAPAASEDIDAVAPQPDARAGPEGRAIAASERDRIVACMDELEEGRAAAVKGAYLNGESYKELAARHAVPVNTMRTWLRRSLMRLRECLSR